MQQLSRGTRVQIYVGETDQVGHKPVFQAILELLRNEGAAGATVNRAIAGFGRRSLIRTAAILRLSVDLPVVVTWVDAPERVDRLLPRVLEIAGSGVVTVEEVGIASYGERAVGKMRFDLQVRDVMTTAVRSVRADATVRDVVALLLGQPFRALPVVDGSGRLVGVVSNSDLVGRGGLRARLELLSVMPDRERASFVDSVGGRRVSEVMTANPVTLSPKATLTDATRLFDERRLKRLPVVDSEVRLVGILSRADVLRAVAEAFPRSEHETSAGVAAMRVARDVMREDVPTVSADGDLPAAVDAVCSTRLNRAVVVEADGSVVGVVSDAIILRALGGGAGAVPALMGRLGLAEAPARRARDLVVTPGLAVDENAPLAEVARVMTEHRRKLVPVVDASGKLLGAIDRADLLAATHASLRVLTTAAEHDEEE